jgi:hypothetical protein
VYRTPYALVLAFLAVAIGCASDVATLTPEYGIEGVALRDAAFFVSSKRGIGRFQVETSRDATVVIQLRYGVRRPIRALEGLEVVEAVSDRAIDDDLVTFEAGVLTLRLPAAAIWRVQFVDFHR